MVELLYNLINEKGMRNINAMWWVAMVQLSREDTIYRIKSGEKKDYKYLRSMKNFSLK